MGRLHLLLGVALALPHCGWSAPQPLTSAPTPLTREKVLAHRKELERAAELAVERAAERAAERAVEKALDSGNSSTITVTVKEGYSNAQKTAEEQAAPGSESTRPFDPEIYDRQYGYQPPGSRGSVEVSAEAEQLGVPRESLNSSVEEQGAPAETASAEAEAELSFESTREPDGAGGGDASGDKSAGSTAAAADPAPVHDEEGENEGGGEEEAVGPAAAEEEDAEALDFSADFSALDFGRKSNTKTYSRSYSKPKNEYATGDVEVDDEEDAEVFRMYSDGAEGWSSSKQEGWVRHRPLWDDSKQSSKSRKDSFWDNFDAGADEEEEEEAGSRSQPEDADVATEEDRISRSFTTKTSGGRDRNSNVNSGKQNQIVVPLATLPLNAKTSMAIYQLLRRETQIPITSHNGSDGSSGYKVSVPMKMFVTIPVPLASRGFQRYRPEEGQTTGPSLYEHSYSPQQFNNEMKEQQLEIKKSNATETSGSHVSFVNQTVSPEVEHQNKTHKPYVPVVTKLPLKKFNAKYSSMRTIQKSKQ